MAYKVMSVSVSLCLCVCAHVCVRVCVCVIVVRFLEDPYIIIAEIIDTSSAGKFHTITLFIELESLSMLLCMGRMGGFGLDLCYCTPV